MTLEDPVAEMRRVLGVAEAAGVPLRAVGGIAVWMRCPSLRTADPPREFHDLDLMGTSRAARETARLLADQGYEPHERFNKLNGGRRLLFFDARDGRRVDVFLDRLEMCHTLDVRDRLELEPETLPLADLLLTKLQIVRLTDRDAADVAALLADHDLSDGGGGIEQGRILAVCSGDWGWWRTVTRNLSGLIESWERAGPRPGPDPAAAAARAAALLGELEACPKSLRWKLRAQVGERVPWYQEPEEIR